MAVICRSHTAPEITLIPAVSVVFALLAVYVGYVIVELKQEVVACHKFTLKLKQTQ